MQQMTTDLQAALSQADLELVALLAPPPDIGISEWAEANLVLRKGTSSRPGPWRTESYQRGIFDALSNPQVRRVAFRKPTQVGWSAILNAIAAYFIDADPCPILFVQPSKESAEEYSKKRIAPLISDCPVLTRKIKPANSRKAGNTLLLKEFDGGFLRFASAGAAKTLRSDQIRILIFDEVDGYADDVDGEGPPIDIAIPRTDSWDDAKILIGGTPAKPKGMSNSDNYFPASDQSFFFPVRSADLCSLWSGGTWESSFLRMKRSNTPRSSEPALIACAGTRIRSSGTRQHPILLRQLR